MNKTITITQKDLEKNNIQNSPSGYIIDELAYACGEWTQEDLFDNNIDYQPCEPYMFDFENDLLENTKTSNEFQALLRKLEMQPLTASQFFSPDRQKLQAGAFIALNFPTLWVEILEEYENNLRENQTESISKEWNTQLEKAKEDYQEMQYDEWLNGDYGDYAGVINLIARYFVDTQEGSFDRKKHSYTFELNEEDFYNAKEYGYNKNQLKAWLLDSIKSSSDLIARTKKQESEKRQAEYKRVKEYKQARQEQSVQARKEKLESMTI